MTPPPARSATRIGIESGTRRVFAFALDWPGWCRSGRDEATACAALETALPRYGAVASRAGPGTAAAWRAAADAPFVVVERLAGSPTTDFGAPCAIAEADRKPLTARAAHGGATLLEAAWRAFDDVVGGAPAQLRKGPRGGGRDRDAIVDHVLGAEVAYGRKLGLRLRAPDRGDARAVAAFRDAILVPLQLAWKGPTPDAQWPPRYALRRITWHVLDHAWEIQDRS